MKKNDGFLALLTFLISFFASAQDITVINHYSDTTGLGKDVSFFLANSAQHTLLINYYEPLSDEKAGRLEELIGNALSFYVDQLIRVDNDEIKVVKNKKTILKELNSIVREGIQYYNYRPLKKFPGFSKQVENQVVSLFDLDFDFIPILPQSLEKNKYYYVQKELNDLKLLLFVEIGNLKNSSLFQTSNLIHSELSPDEQEELLKGIGNLNVNDPLNNLEVELGSQIEDFLAQVEDETEGVTQGNYDLLFSMIKRNSVLLDSLQQQMINARRDFNSNDQSQIEALRAVISSVVQGGQVSSGSDLVPNLPEKVITTFPNGGSSLTLGQQLVLNELIDVMAYHPRLKILITGYADSQGSYATNWDLSKKRAQNVRNFLLHRGIDDNRMILNYFGKKYASPQTSQEDRKVEIEFFVY